MLLVDHPAIMHKLSPLRHQRVCAFIVQAVRRIYLGFTEEKQKLTVVFEYEKVTLDLPFSPPKIVNGWKIQPLAYPQVTF